MKRWLIIALPLLLVTALMFVRPPSFTASQSTPTPIATSTSGTTGTTSPSGVKPGVGGYGGDDAGGKPAYGGHEKDNYDKN